MGRARRKFRHAPQHTQRIPVAVAGSAGQQLAGNPPQTVAEPLAQTLGPHNTTAGNTEVKELLAATSLMHHLSLRAGKGALLSQKKLGPLDGYDEELDLCYEELAQLAGDYIKDMKEEKEATQAAWQDETKSLALRTEARLHGTKLMLSVLLETVDLGLCMIQIFNVPKTFCWVASGYNQVRIDRAARHGIKLKEEQTGTLVQIKDDPVEKAPGNAKKHTKKRAPEWPNFDHLTALLAEYHRNVTELLKDVRAMSNSIKEEEIEVHRLPELATILGHSVVVDLPEHVTRSISDLVFLLNEMNDTRPDVSDQTNTILRSLHAWRTIDKDFWEYAKKHLDQNPVLAKYEYSRRSFLVLYTLWRREETKAFDYVQKHGLLEKLDPELKRKLGWTPQREDKEEDEKSWQSHLARLNAVLPTAEEMMKKCEELWARSTVDNQAHATAHATAQQDDWWKVLVS